MAQQNAEAARERRAFVRLPYRIPCEFSYEGARLAGIVTDIAAHGIFVETSNRIPIGAELELTLREPRGSFDVAGRVTRERRSHRSARDVRASGLGIELETVSEPFLRLLEELGGG